MHCIFTFCVSARFLQPSEEFEHLTFLSTRVAKAQAVLASPARPAITIANAHPRFLSAVACGISCLKQTWPKSPVTSAILYLINPLPIHVIKLRCQKNLNCPCDVKSLSTAMTMASKSGSFRMPKVASVYTLFARPCAANLSVRVTWTRKHLPMKTDDSNDSFLVDSKSLRRYTACIIISYISPQMGIKIQVSSQYIGTDTIRCSTQTFLQFRKTSKTSRILMKQIEKAFPPICELRHSIFTSCIHQRLLVDFQGSISPCGVGNALGIKLPHQFRGLRVGLPCSRG